MRLHSDWHCQHSHTYTHVSTTTQSVGMAHLCIYFWYLQYCYQFASSKYVAKKIRPKKWEWLIFVFTFCVIIWPFFHFLNFFYFERRTILVLGPQVWVLVEQKSTFIQYIMSDVCSFYSWCDLSFNEYLGECCIG